VSPRILLADDVPPITRAIARQLRHLGTFETADGGRDPYAVCLDAIKRLVDDPPDVLIVDGLEGYGATVAEVAQDEGVPCIAHTAEPGRFRRLGVTIIFKDGLGDLGPLGAAVGRALAKESDHG